MSCITYTKTGYAYDAGGYSFTYSWWRNTNNFHEWTICNHTGFGEILFHGTTDDFGNLVEVKL